MASELNKIVLATAVALTSMAGGAQANGFARGTADTDILYEDGSFNFRFGTTFVSPNREYTRQGNPANVGTNAYQDYIIPSAAFKLNVVDNFRCAGTYTTPYGGNVKWNAPKLSGKLAEEFTVSEFGLTCAATFQAGKGNLYLIGGVFQETFDYSRVNFTPAGNADLQLQGDRTGYRVGVGYDIPDIALRAQLLYRSGTDYGANGTLAVPGALVGRPGVTIPLAAVGTGNLPQSIEAKFQTGVAPGWLVFGSAKWTDWSVQKQLLVTTAIPAIGSQDIYNWSDGWTLTGGVGHSFNDMVSGALSLTWDQGVSTGWDLSSDTWTLAGGVALKDKLGGELRFGVGVSYLTAAEETRYVVNDAVDDGWAYAGSLSYKIKW